jgi:hypothetical protein
LYYLCHRLYEHSGEYLWPAVQRLSQVGMRFDSFNELDMALRIEANHLRDAHINNIPLPPIVASQNINSRPNTSIGSHDGVSLA